MKLTVHVSGIGLLGPGLASWAAARAALGGLAGREPGVDDPTPWQPAPTAVPAPQRLPATERRRAGTVVRASIVVADEALAAAGLDAGALPTVFTSSTGDPLNCHLLCEALAAPARLVSPTRFTNSVHNAPAGYWHIAAQSRAPSTSLAAFDASFAAGLLEAAVQCASSQAAVLLVACDVPYPEPLHAVRPVADVMAVALVLAPQAGAAGSRRIVIEAASENAAESAADSAADRADGRAGGRAATPCHPAALDALRHTIPAARALPLLQALAGAAAASTMIEGLPGQFLHVQVDAA